MIHTLQNEEEAEADTVDADTVDVHEMDDGYDSTGEDDTIPDKPNHIVITELDTAPTLDPSCVSSFGFPKCLVLCKICNILACIIRLLDCCSFSTRYNINIL